MTNLVFTIGQFDCLHSDHLHLIREMHKLAVPNGKVVVILFDDYPNYVNYGVFPVQSVMQRQHNLNYFVKDVEVCMSDKVNTDIQTLSVIAKQQNWRLVYMGFDDKKEFPGIEFVNKLCISKRFIKKPKKI
jgi:FAD synthase